MRMQKDTPEKERHLSVRKRNVMLILAAVAIIAGLCHAYCTYRDGDKAAAPAPTAEAPAEP